MSKVFSWKKCKWLYLLSITFEALYCVLSTTTTICRQKQTKFWHFLMYLIVFFDSIKNHFGRINRNCLFTFLRVNNQLHFHEIIKVLVCFLWDQTDELHLNILHVFHKKKMWFHEFLYQKKVFWSTNSTDCTKDHSTIFALLIEGRYSKMKNQKYLILRIFYRYNFFRN